MRKLWDDQGKLLGWLNLVDLGILLLLAMVIGRVWALYRPQPVEYQKVKVTTGLIIRNVPAYIADSIAVGQDLFLDRTDDYLGKVLTKRVAPAELILREKGQLWLVHSPRNYDLQLTIHREGRLRSGPARAAILLGGLPIRVGERLKVHSLYTAMSSEVVSLRFRAM